MLVFALVTAFCYAVYRFFFGDERKRRFQPFPALPNSSFFQSWTAAAQKHRVLPSYKESEAALKDVIKTVKISAQELVRTSGSTKLFEAHRHGSHMFEVGLGIRTTVQYNLFGGSVANLGSPQQIEWLQGVFDRQEIGCFALTECRAGVLSGLICDTTATVTKDSIILDSSSPGAKKRWISNGLVAKWAVVIARLILKDGTDKGPHAFICDLTLPGVSRTDMSKKVAFNGLDNAEIEFSKVSIPFSNMLSGVAGLNDDGSYSLKDPKKPFSFVHVAQRLLSGRICIAGASLAVTRTVLEGVVNYARTRPIPIGKDESVPLSELPVMRDTIARIQHRWNELSLFLERLEKMFGSQPEIDDRLVDAIACAKIECIRFALDSFFDLKAKVGSFSVQEESPFSTEINYEASLYCQRFAEGDAAVLEQKMARDHIKHYAKAPWMIFTDLFVKTPLKLLKTRRDIWLEVELAISKARLALHMLLFGRGRNATKVWLEAHKLVERVARLQSQATIKNIISK